MGSSSTARNKLLQRSKVLRTAQSVNCEQERLLLIEGPNPKSVVVLKSIDYSIDLLLAKYSKYVRHGSLNDIKEVF